MTRRVSSIEISCVCLRYLLRAFTLMQVPTYMRPPYGDYDPAVTLPLLQQTGINSVILWDTDSGDSAGYSVAQQQAVYNSAPSGTSHNILQHETYQTSALDMTAFAINWAKSRGLRMVTVAECMGDANPPYTDIGTPGVRDASWTCYP